MDTVASLLFTKEHEWVRLEGDHATIGITDHAQRELGDIVFVELEPVGDALMQNSIFGSVEAVKAVSDLFMPVSGTIVEHNGDLDHDPSLVNNDPYGKGWLIRVKLDEDVQAASLLSADEYEAMVG